MSQQLYKISSKLESGDVFSDWFDMEWPYILASNGDNEFPL